MPNEGPEKVKGRQWGEAEAKRGAGGAEDRTTSALKAAGGSKTGWRSRGVFSRALGCRGAGAISRRSAQ